MNSNFHKAQEAARRRRGVGGIALVITLLMLSVITFLAIAFLYMSRRNQAAVTASLDQANASAMSAAALARAQSEIMARMMAHGDALDYDYDVSTAYRNPNGFIATEGTNDPINVDYNSFSNGNYSAVNWAQNIANLQYDPEPPVFVDIDNNHFPPTNYDFRFYVDVNRNGRFETNGYQPTVNDFGQYSGSYGMLNGEPEFIGVLRNPLYPHSSSNLFIGRYAYMILPVGKELDVNYIHNFLKGDFSNLGLLKNTSFPGNENDGFARDQGIGSWELNLAGFLDDVSPWAYETPSNNYPTSYGPYNYVPPSLNQANFPANTGNAFDDAEAILRYRYPSQNNLGTLNGFFAGNALDYYNNDVDMLCQNAPLVAPFNYYGKNPFNLAFATYTNVPWPGSYQANQFFDVQDFFDPNKTSPNFATRMILASERTNSFDRYTFQRLISCMAMGSSPEYGVWVNRDLWTNSAYFASNVTPNYQYVANLLATNQANLTLRTKININYDNTAQIYASNAPYAPMPTNMAPWTPIGFFTNAAELLLRSQMFTYNNYYPVSNVYNITYAQFGVTNIPIFRTNQPGVLYDPSVHRLLQLAANIYDATVSNNYISANATAPPYRRPSVFRPIFGIVNKGTTNAGLNIVGYQQVSGPGASAANTHQLDFILNQPFYDLPVAFNVLANNPSLGGSINIWGIPWIVAADKGLPQFYQYNYQSSALYERKTLFERYAGSNGQPDTNRPPQFTNQFYCFWVTNNFGLDGWNPYSSNFTAAAGTSLYVSNYVTVEITNNYNYGYTTNLTNVIIGAPQGSSANPFTWPGWSPSLAGLSNAPGFVTYISTNLTTLSPCYFSPANNRFIYFTNGDWYNQFLPADTNQTVWTAYNWTLSVTNHLVYALWDGRITGSPFSGPSFNDPPSSTGGALLDFVNLGPFGTSTNLQFLASTKFGSSGGTGVNLGFGAPTSSSNPWTTAVGTPLSSLPGLLNQISAGTAANSTFNENLNPKSNVGTNSAAASFSDPYEPTNVILQQVSFVPNDPIVHYTIYDLTNSATQTANNAQLISIPLSLSRPYPLLTNQLGKVDTAIYSPWTTNTTKNIANDNMLLIDPMVCSANDWDFPTNKFPSVGWLGRVHRGTPWQTVFFKSDNPSSANTAQSAGTLGTTWNQWSWSPWAFPIEPNPETYPTNDWALADLFTTAPNDNAARGLLSVNQTNDAAWAAVFAGVIAPTSATNAIPIPPTNIFDLVDANSAYVGINAWRNTMASNSAGAIIGPLHPNGIFHKVGDILGAPALTVRSPFLTNAANVSDEIVERIPQETLSLLKVGEPQFVIFAWGQALKGKGPPFLGPGPNTGIYTNYEITGEVLTRTVCHVVHTNGLKMVVDSFNVESGSGN